MQTLTQPQKSPEKRAGLRLIFVTYALFAIAMALASIILVYSSVYLTLGLVFATFPIAIALAIPAAMVIEHRYEIAGFAIIISLCLCVPIWIARWEYWLPFLHIMVLNISIIALIIGSMRLLHCWMDNSFAMLIVLVIALLWLAFPIWGAHGMIGHSNDRWLIFVLDIHPLIAANSAYLQLGEWVHEKIAYRWLTNLGQDVNYSMPAHGALYSILFHGALSIAFIFMPIKPRPRIVIRGRGGDQ